MTLSKLNQQLENNMKTATAQNLTLSVLAIVTCLSYCAFFIDLPISTNETFQILTLTIACFSFVQFMLKKRKLIVE
jgi:hypothetical protein